MILVALTALLAVCSADKLDRTYLPPDSAQTAGGSPGAIQVPFATRAQGNQGLGGLPQGSFQNEYDGVVVDAVTPGSRANEPLATGLGGPRKSYGSTNSKVGEAAFKEPQTNQGFGQAPPFQRQSNQQTGQQSGQFGQQNQGFGGQAEPSQGVNGQQTAQFGQQSQQNQGFGGQAQPSQGANGQQSAQFGQQIQDFSSQFFQGAGNNRLDNIPGQFSNSGPERQERPQATADRNANIIRYENEVDNDRFNYAFETDNGIIAEENGVNNNGIQAQGGFSYTGDDGQLYSVTYTADEGGYQPKGSHLPTPPPIPEEILRSLEKNAQDEAAGIIDDGSYNAQKYNAGSEYVQSEIDSGKYNRAPTRFGSRPGLNNPSGFYANYEQSSSNPTIGNNAPEANTNNPSYQSESQIGQLSSSSGNNFAFNNDYTSSNNRFQNGRPTLNKPQVPSNNFDKRVETSIEGEDQGQMTPKKTESNNAPFGFSQGGNRTPTFGSFDRNRPTNAFAQNNANANYQQNRQPFGRPQQTTTQDSSNIESTEYSKIESNGQQIQGTIDQQRPSNAFSGSFSSAVNNEYLPPFGQFQQNSRPQSQNSRVPSNKPSFTSPSPGFPSTQINGFQQNLQQPGRFSSSSGQSSRFESQSTTSGFEKAPTSPPDTTLVTPFESSNQDSSTTSDVVSSSFSRVEAEAQKEQLTNLNPLPSTPSSAFAASFASNPQKFSTQNTQQNNRQPSFGSNFNSFNQNRRPSAQPTPTTPRPSFNQPQYQSTDDSYHYNQPSQPFNSPSIKTQGSKFPNAPSNQYNIQPGSNFENQQNVGFVPSTTVTYPRPPTVAPTVPTSSTQKDLGLGPIPQAGGVTDATASSFASETSNTPGQSGFPQRPSFGFQSNRQFRPNIQQKPTDIETSDMEPTVSSQQYQGEIYEYKKPATMLPAQPEKDTRNQFPMRPNNDPQIPESEIQSPQPGLNKPPCCKRPPGPMSVFPLNSGSQNVAKPTKDDREKPEKLIQVFNPSNYQPSSSNFAGENFGGPRKPPSFDSNTGYHY